MGVQNSVRDLIANFVYEETRFVRKNLIYIWEKCTGTRANSEHYDTEIKNKPKQIIVIYLDVPHQRTQKWRGKYCFAYLGYSF